MRMNTSIPTARSARSAHPLARPGPTAARPALRDHMVPQPTGIVLPSMEPACRLPSGCTSELVIERKADTRIPMKYAAGTRTDGPRKRSQRSGKALRASKRRTRSVPTRGPARAQRAAWMRGRKATRSRCGSTSSHRKSTCGRSCGSAFCLRMRKRAHERLWRLATAAALLTYFLQA